MKILFLHGYGQTQESMREAFSGLEKILEELYGAECSYVTAPHKVINFKGTEGRGWFLVEDQFFFTLKEYRGLDESVDKIKKYIEENGPFDGVVGFSQGSVIVSILLMLGYKFKFAVLAGSYVVTDEKYKDMYDKITVPSLHIWGRKDVLVTPDKSEANYNKYPGEKKICYVHKGSHNIPDNNNAKEMYKLFIDKYKIEK